MVHDVGIADQQKQQNKVG